MRARPLSLTAAACLGGALLAGVPASAGASLSLKTLDGTYPQPTFVAQAPGKPRLLFVTERPGVIAVLRDGHPVSHPFLDIQDLVHSSVEQGLLSMAFDPHYERDGRFYVFYTNTPPSRLARS